MIEEEDGQSREDVKELGESKAVLYLLGIFNFMVVLGLLGGKSHKMTMTQCLYFLVYCVYGISRPSSKKTQ